MRGLWGVAGCGGLSRAAPASTARWVVLTSARCCKSPEKPPAPLEEQPAPTPAPHHRPHHHGFHAAHARSPLSLRPGTSRPNLPFSSHALVRRPSTAPTLTTTAPSSTKPTSRLGGGGGGGGSDLRAVPPSQRLERATVRDVVFASRIEAMDNQAFFQVLGLTSFTEADLKEAFKRADTNNDGVLQKQELKDLVVALLSEKRFSARDKMVFTSELMALLDNDRSHTVSYAEFKAFITATARSLDPRIVPLSLGMALQSAASAVVTPLLPAYLMSLHIPATSLGLVVSAFTVGKVLSNVPFVVMCDRYGRRPLFVASMAVMGVGVAGLSLASSPDHLVLLVACRMVTGVGVAASAAASMAATGDISTPLNRARTVSPLMGGVALGAALGPAVGGVLSGHVGIPTTFALAGGAYGLAFLVYLATLRETISPRAIRAHEHSVLTVRDVVLSVRGWSPMLKTREFRNVIVLNALASWNIVASHIALLPLLLSPPQPWALPLAQLGVLFAANATLGFLASTCIGTVCERLGTRRAQVVAALTFGVCTMAFPFTLPSAAALAGSGGLTLATLPLASYAMLGACSVTMTMFATATVALVADATAVSSRSQALSLMRTAADVGFLLGGLMAGASLFFVPAHTAMVGCGALFTASVLVVARRSLGMVFGLSR